MEQTRAADLVGCKPESVQRYHRLVEQHGAATWLYWIAANTGLNLLCAAIQFRMTWIFGSAVASHVDQLPSDTPGLWPLVVLFNVVLCAVLVSLGRHARRGEDWALWTGLVAYAADGVWALSFQEAPLATLLHLLPLAYLWKGLKASRTLRRPAVAVQVAQGSALELARRFQMLGAHGYAATSLYWIAGNTLAALVCATASQPTQWVFGGWLPYLALADIGNAWAWPVLFNLLAVGTLVYLGRKAQAGLDWALWTGFVAYAADGLWALVMGQDTVAAACHLLPLWGMWHGLKASHLLRQKP